MKRGRTVLRLLVLLSTLIASVAFVVTPAYADYTTILRSWRQGECLDSNWDGAVYTLGCNGGNYQNWHIEHYSLDQYRVRDMETGRCLDSNWNGDLYTLPCQDPNDWQKWMLF